MILLESRVFGSIDKTVHADPDYWPTFQLQNVRILPHGKARSKYARCVSLLDASTENPVCVVGELEQVDEDHLDRVLDTFQNSHDGIFLAIPKVTNFCYGEQDRICKLWAEGEAGWFEIRPAEQYQQIYSDMVGAVGAWYYLEDQCNIRGGRKPRNPEVDTLFEVYLKKNRKHETVETVEGVFHASQHFILSQMRKQDAETEEDDIRMKWADTNIYHYFVEQSSDEASDSSSQSDQEKSNESEDILPEPPRKLVKAGKSAKSAGLRPMGLTPRSAKHKSSRSRSALPMHLESDEGQMDGDGTRLVLVSEMKKAGARTSFLEAFLEGRNPEI